MRFFINFIKGISVVVISIVLTSFTINATDNSENFSESILGALVLGSVDKNSDPCPLNMVFITSPQGGFCIDKYEASPSKKCFYLDPKDQEETRLNLERKGCEPVSVKEVVPWRNISQNQAAVACAKAGKRLPSNEEWSRAVLGTPDFAESDQECHIGKLATEGVVKTGTNKDCTSSFGVYDMIGNVWEWVDATIYEGTYEGRTLPKQGFITSVDSAGFPNETNPTTPDVNYNEDFFWIDTSGTRGVFRGGYWGLGSKIGPYAVYAQVSSSFVGIGVGFRCVK